MIGKSFFSGVVLGLLVFCPVSSFASEIKQLGRGEAGGRVAGGLDRVLCIDGLKVFQTIAIGGGNGSGAAVSNIQLYEEKNGKVVPVRCGSDSGAKK